MLKNLLAVVAALCLIAVSVVGAQEDIDPQLETQMVGLETITQTLRGRKEQLLRAAYLTAARADADVVNYLARNVVASQGTSPAPGPTPSAAPAK